MLTLLVALRLAAAPASAALLPAITEDATLARALPMGLVLDTSTVKGAQASPQAAPKPKEIRHIGQKEFDAEVRTSSTPVVVYFFATWCKACKAVSPLVDYLAEQNPQVKFVKVDVDAEPDLAKEFKVASIPHFIGAKDGKFQVLVLEVQVDGAGNVVGVKLKPKP